jgi:hypothetical protein
MTDSINKIILDELKYLRDEIKAVKVQVDKVDVKVTTMRGIATGAALAVSTIWGVAIMGYKVAVAFVKGGSH